LKQPKQTKAIGIANFNKMNEELTSEIKVRLMSILGPIYETGLVNSVKVSDVMLLLNMSSNSPEIIDFESIYFKEEYLKYKEGQIKAFAESMQKAVEQVQNAKVQNTGQNSNNSHIWH